MVDRDGLGRVHRRVPVGHAGDEQPEAHAFGDPAPRRERGVALEALARPLAVHRLEVVEAPDAIEAGVVGKLGARHDLRERNPLLRDVQTKTHLYGLALYGPGYLVRGRSLTGAGARSSMFDDGAELGVLTAEGAPRALPARHDPRVHHPRGGAVGLHATGALAASG